MSESSDERSPGFKNNKLTGKLVAAAVFVVAGTFAVAYSMNYCRECAENTEVASNESETTDSKKTVASDTKPALQIKNVSDSTQSGPKNEKTDQPATAVGQFNPAKTTVNKTTVPKTDKTSIDLPESKSFNSNASAKPKNNNFGDGFQPQKQNALKAPVQENVAAPNPAKRLQQFKSNANQFAGQAAKNLKQTTSGFSTKATGAIKNIGDRAGDFAKNVKGAVQKNAAFNPNPTNTFQANTNPSGTPKQSALPPIKPGGGSFDRSRELKPFAPQQTTGNNNSSLAPQRQSSPFVSNTSTQQRGPVSNLRQPGGMKQPQATQLPRTTSTGVGSSISSLRNPPAPSPVTTPVSTAATPGDRNLEGPQSPSVTIEKIAPREVQVNHPAEFQLVVKNVGRIAAKGVRVFDQIPTGTELVQSAPQPSRGPNNQISWDLDSLNPGQEKIIKLQLKPLRPGEIGSVAQVTFSAQASMRTRVTKPVLAIRHTAEPKVLIGDKVILDIDVKNEGDGAARDVIIQEDLPDGLQFSEGFRELEYAVGTLGPGQSRKVRLELKAAKIGKYRNVLVAHAGGGLQTQHAIDVEVIAPSLVATGEGPKRRFLKRDATHRFAIRNNGTAPATNVELVCRLPSGLRFVDTNNRGKYDENSHSVYWSLAELGVGLVANVEITTKPTEPGNQDLKLEVVSDLNQSANAVCKLNVEHLVDVFFDIDDMVDPIEIGSETSYRLRIVNQGTKTATNVQLQVDFPQGIQPTAVEGNITSNIRGQQIAFSPITSLNPGDSIEITIRGKGITAGDHRVSVNVIADGREVNVSKQESTRVYSDR